MGATTINITLPVRLKQEIDSRVQSGMYASVSEFIRSALRRALTVRDDIPVGEAFSREAEDLILQAEQESRVRPSATRTLKSAKDIDRYLDSV